MRVRGLPPAERRGSVLLWAVFGAMAVFTSAFIASTLASSSRRIAAADHHATAAHWLSEGAVAFAAEALAEALAAGAPPPSRGSATVVETEVHWTLARVTDAAGGLYRLEGRSGEGERAVTSRRIVRARVRAGAAGPPAVALEEVAAW